MDQSSRLFLQSCDDPWWTVAQDVAAPAGEQVEIPFALGIPHVRPFAAIKADWISTVVGNDPFVENSNRLFAGLRRCTQLSAPVSMLWWGTGCRPHGSTRGRVIGSLKRAPLPIPERFQFRYQCPSRSQVATSEECWRPRSEPSARPPERPRPLRQPWEPSRH